MLGYTNDDGKNRIGVEREIGVAAVASNAAVVANVVEQKNDDHGDNDAITHNIIVVDTRTANETTL